MATHAHSRQNPPQLPPLRSLSYISSSRVPTMALTQVNTTTAHGTSAGTIPLSKKLTVSRPLPPIPAPSLAAAGPHSPAPRPPLVPLQQNLSSGSTNSQHSQRSKGPPPSSFHTRSHTRPSTPQRPVSNLFMRSNITPLLTALQEPNVLHAFVWQLEWSDLYNLFTSCKRLFSFFDTTALRDVILARFVPEYRQCLRSRDMQYYQDVPLTVLDLDLLLISQRVPLHRYPIHALKIQSAMLPSLDDEKTTEKLAALTQAHSRFVLLLQSLVHSSTATIPQETEEGTYRPRFSPIQTLRELTFPAPLAYTEPPPPPPPPKGIPGSKKQKHHVRHKSAPTSTAHVYSAATWPSKPPSPRPSADATSSMISSNRSSMLLKKGRRLSIFGGSKAEPPVLAPPPPDEPRALRVYASQWRKSSYWGSHGDFTDAFSFTGSLKRPKRLASRALHSKGSSESSLTSSHSRSPLSHNISRNSISMQPEAKATSPHDLILATSRVRAPILRVFVPCTKLDVDSDSIVKCEQQLVESGLWNHLSTGDIVCNLGYVPPVEDSDSSDGSDLANSGQGEFIMMRPGASSGLAGGGGASAQKWLLFNGHVLVPYTPPDLLPLDQPLNLPTPFYYAHIMPPFTNLSYIITQLPVCDDVPQLTLVQSSKKVKSPHSPSGVALVKKYSWVARVVRMRTVADGEMGEGWFGEWILEGEGTPEGKLLLLNALKGHNLGHREWELVREKSGGGKLWLRLLTI